jgi:choloylglycine hydrolase
MLKDLPPRWRGLALLAMALASLGLARPAQACTTFLVGSSVGKCYDWSMGQGLVLLNPRGLAKQALPMAATDRPARWLASHASVTFNQYGRELPNGGMNDAGLVVEVMWLDETALPPVDARPTVNELQFIQWALDQWRTVDELAAHAADVRVSRVSGRVHYLACDASLACLALEFVKGALVASKGDGLVTPVLTNDTYAASLTRLEEHDGFGGKRAAPAGPGSLDRFVRAATAVKRGDDPRRILGSVHNATSQWEIVYDIARRSVAWKTRANQKEKRLDFGKLAAGCEVPVKMIDIDADGEGDVAAQLTPYTAEADLALVKKSLAGMALPPGTPERVAKYPGTLACTIEAEGSSPTARSAPRESDDCGEDELKAGTCRCANVTCVIQCCPKGYACARGPGEWTKCVRP